MRRYREAVKADARRLMGPPHRPELGPDFRRAGHSRSDTIQLEAFGGCRERWPRYPYMMLRAGLLVTNSRWG